MTTINSLPDLAKESNVESAIPAKYAYFLYLKLLSISLCLRCQ